MRTHEVLWSQLLPALAVYERVRPESRDALLAMSGTKGVGAGRFGPDLEEMIDAGLLAPLTDSGRVKLTQTTNHLTAIVRAATRWPVLFDDSSSLLREYVQKNISSDHREALLWDEQYIYGDLSRHIANRASDPAWIQRTLDNAEPTPRHGRRPAHARISMEPSLLAPSLHASVIQLVDQIRSNGGPVLLSRLHELLGAPSEPEFDTLMHAALLHLLVFPGVDPHSGQLVIGFAADVNALFSRRALCEAETIHASLLDLPPYAVLDLHVVMIAVAGGTVRARASDGMPFKRDAESLASEFTPLDASLGHILQGTTSDRLDAAIAIARHLGFVELNAGPEGRSQLAATADGRTWLAQDHPTRLTHLLERVRLASDEDHGLGIAWESVANGLDYSFAYRIDPQAMALACEDELRRIPSDGAVRTREFVVHAGCERNPFRQQNTDRDPLIFDRIMRRSLGQREAEQLWMRILLSAIGNLLLPWGGVRVSEVPANDGEGNEVIISLTPIGRYLLRLEDTPVTTQTDRTRVIVQPTFEITFLDHAPHVESELAPFCQRLGGGLGVVFRITRDSVTRAAAAGMPVKVMMETLERISAKPIPKNVAVEVQSWHGRQRVVRLDRPWILHCGDAETAERVLGEAPRFLERLSDKVLALRGGTRPETVAKALAAHGITIDTTQAPRATAKPAKRRTRRRRYS